MDFVLRPMRDHHRGMMWWLWRSWDHLSGNGGGRLRGVNLGTGQSSIQPWESERRLGNKDIKRGGGFEKLVNDSAFSGSVPETGFRTIFDLQWLFLHIRIWGGLPNFASEGYVVFISYLVRDHQSPSSSCFYEVSVHRVKTVHPGPRISHLSVGNKQNLFFISCLSFIHILKVKLML